MAVSYVVRLSEEERGTLRGLISGGKRSARIVKRAEILLAADAGQRDEAIAGAVGVGASTVHRTKRRFVEGNVEHALHEQPRPGARRKLSPNEEALRIATRVPSPRRGGRAGRCSFWPAPWSS